MGQTFSLKLSSPLPSPSSALIPQPTANSQGDRRSSSSLSDASQSSATNCKAKEHSLSLPSNASPPTQIHSRLQKVAKDQILVSKMKNSNTNNSLKSQFQTCFSSSSESSSERLDLSDIFDDDHNDDITPNENKQQQQQEKRSQTPLSRASRPLQVCPEWEAGICPRGASCHLPHATIYNTEESAGQVETERSRRGSDGAEIAEGKRGRDADGDIVMKDTNRDVGDGNGKAFGKGIEDDLPEYEGFGDLRKEIGVEDEEWWGGHQRQNTEWSKYSRQMKKSGFGARGGVEAGGRRMGDRERGREMVRATRVSETTREGRARSNRKKKEGKKSSGKKKYCEVCRKTLDPGTYKSHIQGKSHKRAALDEEMKRHNRKFTEPEKEESLNILEPPHSTDEKQGAPPKQEETDDMQDDIHANVPRQINKNISKQERPAGKAERGTQEELMSGKNKATSQGVPESQLREQPGGAIEESRIKAISESQQEELAGQEVQPTTQRMHPREHEKRPKLRKCRLADAGTRPTVQKIQSLAQAEIHACDRGIQRAEAELSGAVAEIQPVEIDMQPVEAEIASTERETQSAEGGIRLSEGEIQPSEGEIQPGVGEIQPSEGEIQPSEEEIQPGEGEIQPGEGEVQPGEGEIQPSGGEIQPSEGEIHPREGEIHPREGEIQPAEPEPGVPQTQFVVPAFQPAGPEIQPVGPEVAPAQLHVHPAQRDARPAEEGMKTSGQKSHRTRGEVHHDGAEIQPVTMEIEPTHHEVRPTEPVVQAAEPEIRLAKPKAQSTGREIQPSEPPIRLSESEIQPSEPEAQPSGIRILHAEPEAQHTEPEIQPVEPEVQPAEPEIQPAEPEIQPAEPEFQPAEPEFQPAEPEIQPAEPEIQPAEPEIQSAEPEIQPTELEVEPAGPEMRLSETGRQAVEREIQSVQPEARPAVRNMEPVDQARNIAEADFRSTQPQIENPGQNSEPLGKRRLPLGQQSKLLQATGDSLQNGNFFGAKESQKHLTMSLETPVGSEGKCIARVAEEGLQQSGGSRERSTSKEMASTSSTEPNNSQAVTGKETVEGISVNSSERKCLKEGVALETGSGRALSPPTKIRPSPTSPPINNRPSPNFPLTNIRLLPTSPPATSSFPETISSPLAKPEVAEKPLQWSNTAFEVEEQARVAQGREQKSEKSNVRTDTEGVNAQDILASRKDPRLAVGDPNLSGQGLHVARFGASDSAPLPRASQALPSKHSAFYFDKGSREELPTELSASLKTAYDHGLHEGERAPGGARDSSGSEKDARERNIPFRPLRYAVTYRLCKPAAHDDLLESSALSKNLLRSRQQQHPNESLHAESSRPTSRAAVVDEAQNLQEEARKDNLLQTVREDEPSARQIDGLAQSKLSSPSSRKAKQRAHDVRDSLVDSSRTPRKSLEPGTPKAPRMKRDLSPSPQARQEALHFWIELARWSRSNPVTREVFRVMEHLFLNPYEGIPELEDIAALEDALSTISVKWEESEDGNHWNMIVDGKELENLLGDLEFGIEPSREDLIPVAEAIDVHLRRMLYAGDEERSAHVRRAVEENYWQEKYGSNSTTTVAPAGPWTEEEYGYDRELRFPWVFQSVANQSAQPALTEDLPKMDAAGSLGGTCFQGPPREGAQGSAPLGDQERRNGEGSYSRGRLDPHSRTDDRRRLHNGAEHKGRVEQERSSRKDGQRYHDDGRLSHREEERRLLTEKESRSPRESERSPYEEDRRSSRGADRHRSRHGSGGLSRLEDSRLSPRDEDRGRRDSSRSAGRQEDRRSRREDERRERRKDDNGYRRDDEARLHRHDVEARRSYAEAGRPSRDYDRYVPRQPQSGRKSIEQETSRESDAEKRSRERAKRRRKGSRSHR